jgi:hypothetical protein
MRGERVFQLNSLRRLTLGADRDRSSHVSLEIVLSKRIVD